jgi:MFS family permease
MMFFVLIRALLGVMEGGYTPTSFTAVAVASKPSRRGLNQGLQQCGVSLLGLALAPIFATQLLNAGLSWRWVFIIIAAPGFIVGLFLIKVLREPKDTMGAGPRRSSTRRRVRKRAGSIQGYNIVVCMIALFGAMCGLFTMAAMVPVYLELQLKLSLAEMGVVSSAIGFGGFLGQFSWPGLSDKLGRKPSPRGLHGSSASTVIRASGVSRHLRLHFCGQHAIRARSRMESPMANISIGLVVMRDLWRFCRSRC